MATKKAADEITEPPPTVREAMSFGGLATARLVAGGQGLDRPIEWVRMMETPEVQPRAGDLILTTGFPIKDDQDAQVRLISRIADGGGAAWWSGLTPTCAGCRRRCSPRPTGSTFRFSPSAPMSR